ncbi:hypothetical protein [Phytohabitans suffuscus]|uniref:Uncharacterized protein n=1 Tax=Phytohabitans suffuscus TaxID=624315 RepID=A0A6F8YAF9_9ACTN|nr:hypothetical protein [Phytohabitans suffuscus]BCB82968.1 hypothetical protein Psuf_002810 [Phytohabitans suffuscus]
MTDERRQAALDSLAMLAQQREEIEAEITAAVAHALNMRATWAQVERAARLQRGTGQRRYGPLLVEERRFRVRGESGDSGDAE